MPAAGEALAIEEPAEFCARLFWELLAKRGVDSLWPHSGAPPEAASLDAACHQRALGSGANSVRLCNLRWCWPNIFRMPLGLDIRVTNKVSQNLHAEMLLRLLGREKGTSASVAGGLDVLRGFLAQADVLPEEYAFYDGSGLSRQNLVSPHATVKLLRYAAKQSWGAEYIESLPQAGVDGTLASRFKALPAAAILRAKTGSLDHVNALSGYLTTARGQRLVFSIFGNNHTLASKKANDIIDEIVREAERLRN